LGASCFALNFELVQNQNHLHREHSKQRTNLVTMQPAPALTPGAIQRISNSTEKQVDFMPRLQVISVKLMHPSANQNDRYRLVLSDGEYYHQSMLATAQNELVTSGQLVENCVVCLEDFVLNEIGAQGRLVLFRIAQPYLRVMPDVSPILRLYCVLMLLQ
jgi:Replication factor-A protein 1, N-terminal domain